MPLLMLLQATQHAAEMAVLSSLHHPCIIQACEFLTDMTAEVDLGEGV